MPILMIVTTYPKSNLKTTLIQPVPQWAPGQTCYLLSYLLYTALDRIVDSPGLLRGWGEVAGGGSRSLIRSKSDRK